MVDVGHSCHDNKWQVMENPADDGIQSRVMDMVNVSLSEFMVTALPANEVPEN